MQAARAAGVGVSELDSMNLRELRKLAVSLGVSSRGRRANGEVLRASCKRALAGQSALTGFFAPRAPPQAGPGPKGGGEVGGAAPASGSQTNKRRRPGAALRPAWMRKGHRGEA